MLVYIKQLQNDFSCARLLIMYLGYCSTSRNDKNELAFGMSFFTISAREVSRHFRGGSRYLIRKSIWHSFSNFSLIKVWGLRLQVYVLRMRIFLNFKLIRQTCNLRKLQTSKLNFSLWIKSMSGGLFLSVNHCYHYS